MGQKCFVCSNSGIGKYFQLAFYHLKYSKMPLVEKLVNMVGDKRDNTLLVCRPSDVVCHSCVTMVENLDRLEQQSGAAKDRIVSFLDTKYSLSSKGNGKARPPDSSASSSSVRVSSQEGASMSFAERKLKSKEAMKRLSEENEKDSRSDVKMKCSTCKYTTNYAEFEKRHILLRGSEKVLLQMESSEALPSDVEIDDSEPADPLGEDAVDVGIDTGMHIVEMPKDTVNSAEVFSLDNLEVVWEDADGNEEL